MDDIDPTNCGTRVQYYRHHKLGLPPCEPCKEAARKYNRERAVTHKEQIYAQKKSWADKNAERLKEKASKYYQEHKEELLLKTREYQKARPEQRAIWNKTYATKHPDRVKAASKRWAENNPDKVREEKRQSQRKRKALKLENGHEEYSELQVLEAYGTSCHLCGEPVDLSAPRRSGIVGWELGLHIDHLVPLSKGGPDTLDNVRPSHGTCNVHKHSSYEDSIQ